MTSVKRIALSVALLAALGLPSPTEVYSAESSTTLATPQSFDGISDTAERSAALFTEAGKVLTSARIKANPNVADDKNHDESLRSRPLKGMVIMTGFTGGPPDWKDGSIYNPEDGGTYKGTIRLEGPDTLKLTGCIIFPLCKTQTWIRIR